MSLSDSCFDLLSAFEKGKPTSKDIAHFVASVEWYSQSDGADDLNDCLRQLGQKYLHTPSEEILSDLETSVKNLIHISAEMCSRFAGYRNLVVKDGKIVVVRKASARKEARALIADLDLIYHRLVELQQETGFRLFGLGHVEKGLRILKGDE
jgi:hypothetical protein